MAINKVEAFGEILIDLTADTVTPADVMADTTFHSADGEERIGTFSLDDELAEQDSIIEELLGELADKSLSDIAVYEDGNGYVVVEPITGISGSGGSNDEINGEHTNLFSLVNEETGVRGIDTGITFGTLRSYKEVKIEIRNAKNVNASFGHWYITNTLTAAIANTLARNNNASTIYRIAFNKYDKTRITVFVNMGNPSITYLNDDGTDQMYDIGNMGPTYIREASLNYDNNDTLKFFGLGDFPINGVLKVWGVN